MKKTITFVALTSILAILAIGCGKQTSQSFVKDFDHKLFTMKLCKDWQDSEQNGAVMFKKSETEGMVIMAADNNTETVDSICANISKAMKEQNPKAKVSETEDIKIGDYIFKKIVGTDMDATTQKEVKMYVLVTTQGSKGLIVQLSNLEGEDQQAMLQTLKIK